jgi:hypothetical protein
MNINLIEKRSQRFIYMLLIKHKCPINNSSAWIKQFIYTEKGHQQSA